jgi:hypothetical protein
MGGTSSFSKLPLWRRAAFGALLAVGALGIPALILAGLALFGGRFPTTRGGVEVDAWLTAAVYPIGIAVAGAVAGASVPWMKRPWHAGVVGFIAALPIFLLLSTTFEPHGPHPYSVEWAFSIFCALVLGVPVGVLVFRGKS